MGYRVDALYQVTAYSSMAVHTATLMVLLGLSSLAVSPRAGIMGIVTSEFLRGLMVRRALPAVILVPFVFG